MPNVGVDKVWEINVHFHKRRLEEDQNMYIREGDFVLYGETYYEIVKLVQNKQLYQLKLPRTFRQVQRFLLSSRI